MTEFHDIFSRKKEIIKKEKPIETKEIIKIDYREQNSFVPTNLKKLGYEIEFLELKVADYIVKDVAIERKTVSDFLSSMINKRLAHQSKEVSLNVKKRTLKPNEQSQFIIESIPGIGPKTAKKLLIKFRTIRKIINASHNELKKIIGKQATIIKSIIDQQYIIHKEQN